MCETFEIFGYFTVLIQFTVSGNISSGTGSAVRTRATELDSISKLS